MSSQHVFNEVVKLIKDYELTVADVIDVQSKVWDYTLQENKILEAAVNTKP
jgi:hypothetical protein